MYWQPQHYEQQQQQMSEREKSQLKSSVTSTENKKHAYLHILIACKHNIDYLHKYLHF